MVTLGPEDCSQVVDRDVKVKVNNEHESIMETWVAYIF